MNLPLHVIVLAAGEGKRMRSRLPKVLMPVAGQPMLAHVLAAARRLQPERIHVVYGHAGDQVRAAFPDASNPDVNWVEQHARRGTGHAVQQVLPHLPEQARVLVLYGDVPLIQASTLDVLLRSGGPLAVLFAELAVPTGYGRLVCDDEGRVTAIVEERDCTPAQRAITRINTGILQAVASSLRTWLAQIQPNNAQGEYYLTDIFALATQAGMSAEAVPTDDAMEVMGANDALQLAELERSYQRRQTRALLLQGVRMADPDRVQVRGEVEVGMDVELDIDVILEGRIQLGDGCRIGPFTRLRNTVLAPDTVVQAHCDLDGVNADRGCQIGPFARLRPGTQLADGVHIGNFVETKQTQVGTASKANHLSYLGDARIGSRVNIGAGTITCNYDGAHKHQTIIGDEVFVGSNSALVAPVVLQDGATIGAGSTISKGAPAGKLTVARARQVTLDGWSRPKKS